MDFALDRIYRVIRFLLDKVIGYAAVVVMFLATSLAIFEVLRRYVFGVVYPWGQDAVTYGLVASIFLYFAVTQARRSHLRVSFAIEMLEKAGKFRTVLFIRAFLSAISALLYGSIAWWAWPTIERSIAMERTTQSMVIPIWPFQTALLVTFALMAIVCLFQLYQDVRAMFGKKVFEWAAVEESIEI
ncbi:MAG: TRAP transporter small permease [Alphaproteobacteria bacterium]|nr:TRAP transporter small permease [Alphaproteobacteria bacterium]